MIEAVADTHALIFYLTDDPKLSKPPEPPWTGPF
jgi:hypothetical protein